MKAERLPFPESFLDVVLELLETKKLVGSRHGQGGPVGVTALERPNGKKARHAPAPETQNKQNVGAEKQKCSFSPLT